MSAAGASAQRTANSTPSTRDCCCRCCCRDDRRRRRRHRRCVAVARASSNGMRERPFASAAAAAAAAAVTRRRSFRCTAFVYVAAAVAAVAAAVVAAANGCRLSPRRFKVILITVKRRDERACASPPLPPLSPLFAANGRTLAPFSTSRIRRRRRSTASLFDARQCAPTFDLENDKFLLYFMCYDALLFPIVYNQKHRGAIRIIDCRLQ